MNMENQTDKILLIFSLALMIASWVIYFILLIFRYLKLKKEIKELNQIMKKGVPSSVESVTSTKPSEIAVVVTDTVIPVENGYKIQISEV